MEIGSKGFMSVFKSLQWGSESLAQATDIPHPKRTNEAIKTRDVSSFVLLVTV